MTMFASPEVHAANPPSTWSVEKVPGYRLWRLKIAGNTVQSFKTKREAEEHTVRGHHVALYEQESRWYAGKPVAGWRPYADILAEREARAHRRSLNAAH